jgi:hypothetical protein
MAFNMALVAAFLGIAEAAQHLAILTVTRRRRGEDSRSVPSVPQSGT